ncbi:hypothetical protein V5O48_009114 [Marasmius crinis-equi]|uniref:Uncharacterized protein n=1 Tax=Marasmius crinis-equi TaxID=585013 RepID=A0ABR3FC62_9AGAR
MTYRNFLIGGHGNFSTVQRDQHNHYTQIIQTTERKRRIIGNDDDDEEQCAECHDVRYGDIVLRRNLGAGGAGWWFDGEKQEWMLLYEWKMLIAEVQSEVVKAAQRYTVISYQGPEK